MYNRHVVCVCVCVCVLYHVAGFLALPNWRKKTRTWSFRNWVKGKRESFFKEMVGGGRGGGFDYFVNGKSVLLFGRGRCTTPSPPPTPTHSFFLELLSSFRYNCKSLDNISKDWDVCYSILPSSVQHFKGASRKCYKTMVLLVSCLCL